MLRINSARQSQGGGTLLRRYCRWKAEYNKKRWIIPSSGIMTGGGVRYLPLIKGGRRILSPYLAGFDFGLSYYRTFE